MIQRNENVSTGKVKPAEGSLQVNDVKISQDERHLLGGMRVQKYLQVHPFNFTCFERTHTDENRNFSPV